MTDNYHFNNVVIASGPVIIEDRKVLLNRHGENLQWKFPGGDITAAESDLETWAKRKVAEEMGLEVKIIQPLSPLVVWQKEEVIILIHYLAELINEVITPADYIKEYAWFDIDSLPADCHQNVFTIIEEYKKL